MTAGAKGSTKDSAHLPGATWNNDFHDRSATTGHWRSLHRLFHFGCLKPKSKLTLTSSSLATAYGSTKRPICTKSPDDLRLELPLAQAQI
jgi:hypothetical protein